jgi:hypothetical protein
LIRDEARHAGRRGGTERHRRSRELKQWALAEATGMRGADIEIARQLARRLPAEYQETSADPERLIYDALRSVASNRRIDQSASTQEAG